VCRSRFEFPPGGGVLIAGAFLCWLRSVLRPSAGIPSPTVWFMNRSGLKTVHSQWSGILVWTGLCAGRQQIGVQPCFSGVSWHDGAVILAMCSWQRQNIVFNVETMPLYSGMLRCGAPTTARSGTWNQ